MITPLDIQNKEFKKTIRGYNESEVDQFLDDIIKDHENLYKENLELKDKIVVLNDQIRKYDELETTLKDALIVAQTTADEVIRTARDKASLIVEDAELTAEKLVHDADEDVRNVRKEYEYLMKEIFIFKTRYKSFIEAQLITLDEFYDKIEDQDINRDINKVVPDDLEERIGKSDLKVEDRETEDINDLGA